MHTIHSVEGWLNESFSREGTGIYDDMKLAPVCAVLAQLPPGSAAASAPITIAGTKGKGSTLAFIEAGLCAAGSTCIAFTSPHVNELSERWRINAAPVNADALQAAAHSVATAEDAAQENLTYFERCFAIAVRLTTILDLDYFLCEVGLGGRLDCANALDTRLAICTAISYDHCAVLGYTLAEIATEKLAICRPTAPLILAAQSAEAAAAIATLTYNCQHQLTVNPLPPSTVLGMIGAHQYDNASTALCALQYLLPTVDARIFRTAFAHCHLPARCQVLRHGDRTILIDAAHNAASMQACLSVANSQLRPAYSIILGANIDKELHALIDTIATHSPHSALIRCGFSNARAAQDTDWPSTAQTTPWHQHIASALASIPDDQDCCITGSFYLAGEALAHLAATPSNTP